MIKAEHNLFAQLIFNPYLKRLLKKHFCHFYLVNQFPNIARHKKLIVTPNHFSWWDGFFIDYLFKRFSKRKLHIMMLEEQLKRFWFFRKLGAFSISPNSTKSIIETAEYTKAILSDANNFVVYYPQGRIEPFDAERINIQNGLRYFIPEHEADVVILPIAFKIQFHEEKKPEIIVRFGEMIDVSAALDSEIFKQIFLENVRLLSDFALKRNFISDFFGAK